MFRMLEYLATAATLFASSLIQLVAGCAVVLIVSRTALGAGFRKLADRSPAPAAGFDLFGRLGSSATAAACGALLPLGLFGAVPIAAAALSAGTGAELVLAFISSNILFNTLVPFSDPFFIWKTGYPRVILALAVGIAAALTAQLFKDAGRGLLRDRPLPSAVAEAPGLGAGARYLLASFGATCPFMVLGALAGTAFRSYGLGALMNFMFTNPLTHALPYVFAQADVTNPFFLLATRILMTLTDLSGLAALALILNIRGIVAYFVYFALFAALLGATAFM
jgi:uncharacterized membrane protein YraQ (UPF0718 family)